MPMSPHARVKCNQVNLHVGQHLFHCLSMLYRHRHGRYIHKARCHVKGYDHPSFSFKIVWVYGSLKYILENWVVWSKIGGTKRKTAED